MISGARLRQARELAGLTQAELSAVAGIPQPRLSGAERYGEDLPESVMIHIAAATGFPLPFFETQPWLLISDPPHFRAQGGATATQIKQARRAGEVVAEQALAMRSRLRPPRLRMPAGTTSPELAAGALRMAFGVSATEPIRDLPLLAERNGLLVVAAPLAAFKKDAFSAWTDEIPIIVLLSTHAGDRQAWSTAHELGHLLLHRGLTPQRTLEDEANEFAMHFLLPLGAFRRELPAHPTLQDFALLKRRWGVSVQALIRAARRIGAVDADRYTSLFRQISARGERLRERVALPPVKPRGFRKMAEVLYGPNPASGLAKQAYWTITFADDVLAQHAIASELPIRPRPTSSLGSNVTSLASRRSDRRSQSTDKTL
jgi:Zn-dependent peptidase ImmA (M78 family)/transcriptional regulator with XRE-family HTH domain